MFLCRRRVIEFIVRADALLSSVYPLLFVVFFFSSCHMPCLTPFSPGDMDPVSEVLSDRQLIFCMYLGTFCLGFWSR